MATNSIVTDIYQQFIDYFGEDRVDLQKYSREHTHISDNYLRENFHIGDNVIMVHWPTVEVANEFDEKVEIWDLYSITIISPEGKLRSNPMFNRSTYDSIQWNSDYAHSHLSGINKSNPKDFRTSCLGTGPIRHTINRLSESSYTDLDIWNLYIWELDKYVHVESISGVPYRKIRNIGTPVNLTDSCIKDFNMTLSFSELTEVPKPIVNRIVKLLLEKNVLSFSYCNGKYSLGMSFEDCLIKASDAFIECYNSDSSLRDTWNKETLYRKNVMVDMIHHGSHFYYKGSHSTPIEALINTELFTFKGNPVVLSLKDFRGEYTLCEVHVLHVSLLSYIVYSILKYVNASYGRKENNGVEVDKKTRIF